MTGPKTEGGGVVPVLVGFSAEAAEWIDSMSVRLAETCRLSPEAAGTIAALRDAPEFKLHKPAGTAEEVQKLRREVAKLSRLVGRKAGAAPLVSVTESPALAATVQGHAEALGGAGFTVAAAGLVDRPCGAEAPAQLEADGPPLRHFRGDVDSMRRAVARVRELEGGRTRVKGARVDVAREFGVNVRTLSKWIARVEELDAEAATRSKGASVFTWGKRVG